MRHGVARDKKVEEHTVGSEWRTRYGEPVAKERGLVSRTDFHCIVAWH